MAQPLNFTKKARQQFRGYAKTASRMADRATHANRFCGAWEPLPGSGPSEVERATTSNVIPLGLSAA